MRHIAILLLTALLAFSPGSATAEMKKTNIPGPTNKPITRQVYPDLKPFLQAYQKPAGAYTPSDLIPENTLVTSTWPTAPPRMVTLYAQIKNLGAGKAGASKAVLNITAGDDALPCTSLPQTLHQTVSCPELGPGALCQVMNPHYEGLLPAPKVTKICVTIIADTEPPQQGTNYPGVVTEKNPNGSSAENNNYGSFVFRVKNY